MDDRPDDFPSAAPSPLNAHRQDRAVWPAVTTADRSGDRSIRPSYQRILDAYDRYGAMTPDELAAKLSRSVFYTRPRCSELRGLGLLHPTGETRPNSMSGLLAEVLSR